MSTDFIDGETTVPAKFLNAIFGSDGHVHDGKDEDGSAPLVNPKNHMDWGDNGYLKVGTDTTSTHALEHVHSGTGNAVFTGDILRALEYLASDVLQAYSTSRVTVENSSGGAGGFILAALEAASGDYVSILNDAGSPGGLDLAKIAPDGGVLDLLDSGGAYQDLKGAVLEATSKVLAAALESDVLRGETVDRIDVEDSGGTSGLGGFILDKLQQGQSAPIDVYDGSGNVGDGRFRSRSDPQAMGRWSVDAGNTALNLVGDVNYGGVLGNYATTGVYDIDFNAADKAADLRPEVQVIGKNPAMAVTEVIDASTVKVHVFDDTGSSFDPAGIIVKIYH